MKYIKTFLLSLLSLHILLGITFAQQITVSTVSREPFSYEHNGSMQGFSIELWQDIAKELNLESSFAMQDSFSNMLTQVASGSVDVAAANISITSEREATMDFSHAIFDSGLQFVSKTKDIKELIYGPGTFSFLLFGIIVMFFFIWKLGHNLLSKISRIVLIVSILGSIFWAHQLYTQWQVGSISSYKDITTERIGTSKSTTMSSFLDKKNIPYIAYDDFQEVLIALERGDIDLALGDAAVMQYKANMPNTNIMTTGKMFAPDKIAFAFPEDSSLVEPVNNILLQMKEDGRYATLLSKYFK